MGRRFATVIGMAVMVASAPALAGDKDKDAEKVMPNGEPIICKKSLDTGSLVKKTKRCYTKAQWTRIADAGRANAQRMVSDHTSAGDLSN